MTFVEAAVLLLGEAGTELGVEELVERALARDLLSRPGKAPLSSMKGRLTSEVKKGKASRLVRVSPGVWALPAAPETAPETAPAAPVASKPQLTDEERELSELYEGDLSATPTGAAHAEFRDAQTADEDRPLRPEILARDRRGRSPSRDRGRGRERGRERSADRGGRSADRGGRSADRGGRSADRGERPAERASSRGRDRGRGRAKAGTAAADVTADVPSGLIGGAIQCLANRGGDPQTLGQLVNAMQGKRLLGGAPSKPARAIKAALLHDASVRGARGLRPRVACLGGDRFALGVHGLDDAVAHAEAALESALRGLEAATRTALAERLLALGLPALERAVHAYLCHVGWRDVSWVKRVGKSSYATASAPGGGSWMLAVRVGPGAVDRRGVGELRAGVAAKGLDAGLLLSPAELSDDAGDELDRDGEPISVVCGPSFATALAAAGIGIVATAAPALYLDPQFFAEISDE